MMEVDKEHDDQPNVFTRSINLQDMCLTAVIRDIQMFVYNKTTPQKHIDFLFRAYSDEVFSRHKALKKSMDKDTMLWFLNPHVKKVTIPHVFHSERILQQLKVIGSRITSLTLENLNIPEKELSSIVSCIPHVVHLNLSLTSCDNETLACIQKFCPHLESLDVSLSSVSDHGLENLCQGKLLLKKLNVLYCCVSDSCIIATLDGMPSLECVLYDNLISVIHKNGIAFEKQFNLTELTCINFPHVWDNSRHLKLIEDCVKICPRLRKLHFKDPVSEEVLNACAHFQNLEELKIKLSHKRIVNAYDVLTPILPLSENLKTLILSCVRISPVKLLENFRNLENLCLKRVSFTPFEKKDIKITETNLLSLVIKDIHINDKAVQAITLLISLSKNVTKLYMKHIKYLPPGILDAALISMKNLAFVNFGSSRIAVPYANLFLAIPSVTTIIMNNENISAVELFRKNTACTLSWRNMSEVEYKPENNQMDYDDDEHDRYYYQKNEYVNDETDLISEQCYSCSSEESDMSDFDSDFDSDSDSDSDDSWRARYVHVLRAIKMNTHYFPDIDSDSDNSFIQTFFGS